MSNWEEKCKELENERDHIVATVEKFHEVYVNLERDFEKEKRENFDNQQKLIEFQQKYENEKQNSIRFKTDYEVLANRLLATGISFLDI